MLRELITQAVNESGNQSFVIVRCPRCDAVISKIIELKLSESGLHLAVNCPRCQAAIPFCPLQPEGTE